MAKHEGIEVRHERTCRSSEGGRCNCNRSYRASLWSARDGKLIRKTSRTSPPLRDGEATRSTSFDGGGYGCRVR